MVKINLKTLKDRAQNEIEKAKNSEELNQVSKRYLGKQGELTLILRSLEKLSKVKRTETGKEANEIKKLLGIKFDEKVREIKERIKEKVEEEEWVDITAPGQKPVLGHLHPLTQVKKRVEEIFQTMGFSVAEGPEMEDEWHNFDALNIPPEHPAREALSLGKTFYLKGVKNKVMRTQTSSVQIRYMKKNDPPFRVIVVGKVFRAEATDASHETNFYQIEGLMIGKEVSVANFKAIIEEFFKRFFGKLVVIRLRPGYFPFVEPGFEVDMSCAVCGAKGCPACKHSGWVELLGAGMVHPSVLKAGGLVPKHWQGFAFGMSLDRLAMMKHKINDIRLFHSGDLRFLNQF